MDIGSSSYGQAATYALTVITWNVNHLSDDSWALKANHVATLLAGTAADVLVLQEVNLVSDNERGQLEKWLESNGYRIIWAPIMWRGNTGNTAATGTQWEYYPIIFRNTLTVDATYVISDDNATKQAFKPANRKNPTGKVPWVSNRPTIVRRVVLEGGVASFWLATIHTSPSFKVEQEATEAIGNVRANFKGPTLWVGDWYVKPETNVSRGTTWSTYLKDQDCAMAAPDKLTNLPHHGQGMVADYFVTHGCACARTGVVIHGANHQHAMLYGWQGVSDHAPVSTVVNVPEVTVNLPLEVKARSER